MEWTGLLAQVDFQQIVRSFMERAIDRPRVTLLELLIIGSIVYAILNFLEGTRGARMVRALIMILAISFAVFWLLAELLDFERIKVLYPHFVMGVFLVSLVSFQTELRRMLLRIGAGGWLQFSKGSNETIDAIVRAVERLSKNKIGALMAVQRTTELGALMESGTQVDAEISAELLETIFYPGTPLHDLGVIVRHGRIMSASCQFPLAESGDVDRTLGSRHRAALGMSQEGDAVVVVVSEESGAISVAIHGRLRRALKVDTLRQLLERELLGGSSGDEKPGSGKSKKSKRVKESPESRSAA